MRWIDAYRSALEERLDRFGEMLAEEESQAVTGAGRRDRGGERDKRKEVTKGEPL